jgi:hypothetical protein
VRRGKLDGGRDEWICFQEGDNVIAVEKLASVL